VIELKELDSNGYPPQEQHKGAIKRNLPDNAHYLIQEDDGLTGSDDGLALQEHATDNNSDESLLSTQKVIVTLYFSLFICKY
jgi:hypothetical protein